MVCCGKPRHPAWITGLQYLFNCHVLLRCVLVCVQLKEAVTPLKSQAEGLISQLNQLVGQVPGLSVPLSGLPLDDAQTWSLTTYVDDNLRVARGDGGGVFIYSRV